jgi:SAM-dependent methyltransferase
MNTKILQYLLKNLEESFKLERWSDIRDAIGKDTVINQLPWTPVRFKKFLEDVNTTFDINVEQNIYGNKTVTDLSDYIDQEYSARFWGGGVWQPRTDLYQYSGWNIVDEINKRNPKAVLDVGCGYNQFKPRIQNLVGIDKYNNSADYMVDILEYNVEPETYDAVIVFGSINFGTYDDVSARFKKVFDLTAPGGRIYVRANPGESHKNGPWIEIFPWDFETAHRISKENNISLVTFKRDNGNRLYFVYEK